MNYEKNLKYISSKFPYLLKELSGNISTQGVEIETSHSRNGMPIARLTKDQRKIFLNSAYDPELEAERWVERRSGNHKSVLILCGGGFLYHLKAILKSGQYKKVVCYEPAPAILKSCINEMDLSDFKGDFLLITGANYHECANLTSQYLMYQMLDTDWAILPPYQEIFSGEIEAFQNALQESVRISRANLATTNHFGEQWVSNAVKNLCTISSSPGVGHFFNQFNGIPAVVVSAGPSLEKNIHLVNEIKEKAVIICAGTSIRAMRKFGMTPHFLVAFDGTDYNKTIYSNLDLDDICLVYNYRFNHEALSYFGSRKVYMKLDIETFSDFLSLKCGGYEFGAVRSGYSVAHPSLDLAIKLGCSPVIMIGQDLAYTGDKRYAESQYQQVVNKNQLPSHCFITKDIYGQDIVTDNQLDSFRLLFELMVEEYYKGKTILNATEGGQPIKGVPNYKLVDLINQYCRQERGINRKIEEQYNLGLKELQRHLSRGFDIDKQMTTMAEQGSYKMGTLFDRVQQLRNSNFIEESIQGELNLALNKVADEYGAFLTTKDWRLFLKDLQDWKIAPNQIAIANLGMIETKEAFKAKLQYWSNIIGETKKYLEYVIKQLVDTVEKKDEGGGSEALSIVKIASSNTPGQIAERIRNGGTLNQIQADLEAVINQGNRKDLNEFRYLYGLVLFKKRGIPKAVQIMEQAQRYDNNDAKVSFLLYRCYRRLQNFSKIQECLENCLRLGFKPDFCRRMLVKNAYHSKNYVSANNYIIDFQAILGMYYSCIRVDCLHQMQLNIEANDEFQDIIAKFQVRKQLRERLNRLLAESKESDYERNYRINEGYFEKRGIQPGNYSEAGLKNCNYLGNEYIYNTDSKRFLLAVNQPQTDNLEISINDTLLICDTDDPNIYNHLKRIFQESQTEIKQSLTLLPIFIIEHQFTNWQLIMQKFDFNELSEFRNIHFLIGVQNKDLEHFFLDDGTAIPSVLYGTELDEIKKLLENVKDLKESSYQDRLTELQEYYHGIKPERPNKVLIVTSIKEELLLQYGKVLQLYLNEQGFESELAHESAPCYKFNKYADLNLLERLRPDLVIHLFAVAEELEAYKNLGIPFISWRIIDRWLVPNVVSDYPLEKVLISGESKVNSSLTVRGFFSGQIKSVLLPYLPPMVGEMPGQAKYNQISIIKDLNDHQKILESLAASILGLLNSEINLSGEEIIGICHSIFFKLLTGLLNQSSLAPEGQFYFEIIREEFLKKNRIIEHQKLQLLVGLFQRELENSLLTLIQVKWLINKDQNLNIKLCGAGWENDLNLKCYQEASIELFSKEYQHLISQSKINIYPSLMLNNNSYLQPDLINGIAGGGFFLVNGSLAQTVGEKVLEPFAGLLEVYRNREELLEKVEYFLNNETERSEKALRLQEHILKNFGIDQVAKVILNAYQEIS